VERAAAQPDLEQVTVDISGRVVARLAPQEAPLFPAISAAFLADPNAVQRQPAGGGDQMLGFGDGSALPMLAPVVLAVLSQVVGFLAHELTVSLRAETPGVVNALVKRAFKPLRAATEGTEPAAASPELTDKQLEQVRTIALEKARQLGLPANQAELLADAVIGELAVAT
jgi:hypothetical protein